MNTGTSKGEANPRESENGTHALLSVRSIRARVSPRDSNIQLTLKLNMLERLLGEARQAVAAMDGDLLSGAENKSGTNQRFG